MKEINERLLSDTIFNVAGNLCEVTGLNLQVLYEQITDIVVKMFKQPFINMEDNVYVAGDKVLAYAGFKLNVENREQPVACFQVARLLSPLADDGPSIDARLAYDTTKIVFKSPKDIDDLISFLEKIKEDVYSANPTEEVYDGNG